MIDDNFKSPTKQIQQETPGLGMFDSLLVSIRIVASVGAVSAIIIGVVLAFQLFGFFRNIIEEPTATINSWQQAMDSGRPVLPDGSEVAVEVEHPPSAAESIDGTSTAESGTAPEASVIEGTSPEDVQEPADTLNAVDDALQPTPVAPTAPTHPETDDVPSFILLADRTMDRLEVGEFSWLIGVGVLVMFCWLLVKIPAMLITAGTRLLLGLLNVNADPS